MFGKNIIILSVRRIRLGTIHAGTAIGAFVFGLLAQAWARYSGFNSTADLIIAGSVMPFVPGIALTNAVRDIMTNHINSGMSKLFESLLITLALGAGTSVALVLMK